MKKIFPLLCLALVVIQFGARAERINIPGLKIPALIISEVRPDAQESVYVELTNVGDTAIDLSSFGLYSFFYNSRINEFTDSILEVRMNNAGAAGASGLAILEGVLQPGESFVVANAWDANDARGSGIPRHNRALAQIGNKFIHKREDNNLLNGWIDAPEWQCFGRDSVPATTMWSRTDENLMSGITAGYLLKWYFPVEDGILDSTYIDNFNFFFNAENNPNTWKGHEVYPIAGVVDAMTTGIMVRKPQVNTGNLDWTQSRGVDPVTSEWLVIPKNTSNDRVFQTVGVNGVADLKIEPKDPSNIMVNGSTISIPWQIVRGDSLSRYFNLNPGMAWSYDLVGSFEDSSSYIARSGDSLTFYAVGNELKKSGFTLQVREPEADVALVFPKRRLEVIEEIVFDPIESRSDTIYTRTWSNFIYAIAEGPEIDSIVNVAFATRTDTLLKYLEKPGKATWEFIFVDDQERVDLKFGDKLKVTSEDGTISKEYFVSVNDHVLSNTTLLSTVTWPDVDKTLYPRWNMGDTLVEFTPLKTEYIVELRFDATNFPAFQFIPENLRSRMEIVNAVDIDGSPAQRTTSVTVTSESDTLSTTYNFQFVKQGTPVQPNIAEPFFSEFDKRGHTQGYAIEIYNPGTDELDLSQYVVVRGSAGQTWQEAVETVAGTSLNNYTHPNAGLRIYQSHYFPSKRWAADGSYEAWNTVPNDENPYVGKGFLRDDNQTDPWVEGKDVWVMGVTTRPLGSSKYQTKVKIESDFLFRGHPDDNDFYAWDSTLLYHQASACWTYNYLYLLKVLDTDILDGTKDVRDASAYELIDRFEALGDSLGGVPLKGTMSLIRKPFINKGNLELIGGGNETAESSEWIVNVSPNEFDNLGLHIMDPITNFKSTVTSIKLLVSPGYRGSLSITGNVTDYTPASMAAILDKADESQTLEFKRGSTILADDQALAADDVLEVTSGDGKNVTSYKLINTPLDSNTSLMAKAGSGLTVTGTKVYGVTLGMTLKDAVSKLEVAEKSILNVLDASGNLQPLVVHNTDSLIYDVLVSDQVMLEVVAENSDKVTYLFDFGFSDNTAVLSSNVLKIDQEKKLIMELPLGSSAPSILAMVFANEGATVKVLDKAGFTRETGYMNIDDRLEVTAADGVTKVMYRFTFDPTVSVRRNIESLSTIELFPNPTIDILHIGGIETSIVHIYALTGELMISKSGIIQSVDVSNIPSGMYIIQMIDAKGNATTGKFLKKR